MEEIKKDLEYIKKKLRDMTLNKWGIAFFNTFYLLWICILYWNVNLGTLTIADFIIPYLYLLLILIGFIVVLLILVAIISIYDANKKKLDQTTFFGEKIE